MVQTETPVWGIKEFYEKADELEGEVVHLRGVLANMGPQMLIKTSTHKDNLKPHLAISFQEYERLHKKIEYERDNYPQSDYEEDAVNREFGIKLYVLEKDYVLDPIEREYGLLGRYFVEDTTGEVTIAFGKPDRLNATEIEALARLPIIEVYTHFPNPTRAWSPGTSVKGIRLDDPDIYSIHFSFEPEGTVDPTADPAERVRNYVDKYIEKFGKPAGYFDGHMSETAPRLVDAIRANRIRV